MKTFYLFIVFAVISQASFSQTQIEIQKAKAAAKAYLLKRLNDPASYKAASWGKLEKTYSSFDDSKMASNIDEELEIYNKGKANVERKLRDVKSDFSKDYSKDSTYLYYIDLKKQVDSTIDSLNAARISAGKAFKPKFDGYVIEHSFRAKNKFNALILQNYVFVLTSTFKVTSAADADDLERQRQELQREIDELTKKN